MKIIYKITLLFLLFPLITSANNEGKKHEKNRKINKTYTVNKDANVAIDNKYGDIKITTWSKNEVEIDVTITVKGDDLDEVESMLENIDVEFDASNSFVSAKTLLEKHQKSWSFWKRSRKLSYKIDYSIRMPISNSVDLDNDYGNIYLNELNGRADINCDYGKISIGQLSADNNNINIDYCSSSTIDFMKSGNLNADYSRITIEESETIKSNTDYTTVKFGTIINLDFNVDYGSVSIGTGTNINGNSDYASMSFGTIKKNLEIETDYGAISVKELANGFESVIIDAQYAGIKIGLESNSVFDFVMDLQYAGFKSDNDQIEFSKKNSKNMKKYYEGKYGKGSTNSKIKIRSQYGGVSLREN